MRERRVRRPAERSRLGRGGRQRGSALIEFAVVLPILVTLVFGMIEFGIAFNNNIALRQGVREAARQGAVGNFGPTYSTTTPCHLTGAATASDNLKNLICQAKNRIGLDASKVRVKILSGQPDFSTAGTFAKADSIIVCAQYPLDGVTSLFGAFFGGSTLRTKTSMRIELSDMVATGGEETPPEGGDWSWCTVSSVSP
ncbi:MAG: pilus assembly protein [Actinobacteria bacterium]|nr:pilus assembly protein [Actinomycetota bacterium]